MRQTFRVALVDHLRAHSGRVGTRLAALPREPAERWAILACIDARLHVESICALKEGDAHVLRNAGAVVTDDVIRTLVISSSLLGAREFAVIAHTGCGLLGLDEREARATVARRTGGDPAALRFLSFTDLDDHVRRQVRAITGSALLPRGAPVSGWVFDIATGTLREVVISHVGETTA